MTTIGGLASAGGVGVETVRYYQRRGLMETPPRAGGVRRYGEEDARRLHFIRQAQAAGFSLDEIAELIALDASDDRVRVRELVRGRIAAIEAKVRELSAAKAALEHLAQACAESRDGACPIIAAFHTSAA